MKKLVAIFVLMLFAISISGCGVAYQMKRDELLKTATIEEYGPKPPSNHRDIEQQIINSVLKDPDSAKFQSWNDGYTTIIQSGLGSPTPMLVWMTSVDVNAKNSYGGYTGYKTWYFAWSNGRIVATGSPDSTTSGTYYTNWNYM